MAVAIAAPTVDPGLGSRGNVRSSVKWVTCDNSYVTGGYPITAAQLGLTRVKDAIASVKASTVSVPTADPIVQTDGSILLRLNAPTAQIAGAVDVSATVVQIEAFGDA